MDLEHEQDAHEHGSFFHVRLLAALWLGRPLGWQRLYAPP